MGIQPMNYVEIDTFCIYNRIRLISINRNCMFLSYHCYSKYYGNSIDSTVTLNA